MWSQLLHANVRYGFTFLIYNLVFIADKGTHRRDLREWRNICPYGWGSRNSSVFLDEAWVRFLVNKQYYISLTFLIRAHSYTFCKSTPYAHDTCDYNTHRDVI